MRTASSFQCWAPGTDACFQAASTSALVGLLSFALDGLLLMFNERRQLFCHRRISTENGIVQDGVSQRYTSIALLGLSEMETAGAQLPFDIRSIYSSLVQDLSWISGIGDIGLLLWTSALLSPATVESLIRGLDCESVLNRYRDAHEARTTELAWFLAGLAQVAELSPQFSNSLTDIAIDTYHRLEENHGEYGFFTHMNPRNSLAGKLRARIGNFADQAYPIYAMSQFARSFHIEEPLGLALDCASAVCNAQGVSGQWWWLYDTRCGQVSSRYPVYSVHQYGLGPMALFAVEKATGQSFRESIYKGVGWLLGENEIGAALLGESDKMIWRGVLPKHRRSQFWEMAISALRPPNSEECRNNLEIAFEQRPYEFGWLLFAFAGRVGTHFLAVT